LAQVDEFSQACTRGRSELENLLKMAVRLRQGVLSRAFTGQLVPQNPTDEPASVLLDRIRAERKARSDQGRRERATRRSRKTAATVETPPPPPATSLPAPTTAVQQELPL
ncbi:hypothetical protein NGM37_35665, partial [Streptomyces sp. TRM76130]|nr:hypothetical protein [Streptomyces sp. TRM76130]